MMSIDLTMHAEDKGSGEEAEEAATTESFSKVAEDACNAVHLGQSLPRFTIAKS